MIKIVLFGSLREPEKEHKQPFLKRNMILMHLSTGDIFRYHMKNDTPLGKKLNLI